MTPSDLKYNVETKTESYFFTRKSMKFFGDTMSNYGCCDGGKVDTWTRKNIEVWELWRKRAVKCNNQDSAFFCKKTFDRILPKK